MIFLNCGSFYLSRSYSSAKNCVRIVVPGSFQLVTSICWLLLSMGASQIAGGIAPWKVIPVKIFIMVMFGNAMNPWEIHLVLSQRKIAVPSLYARSRSASPGLPWSGLTQIISRPDHSGFQDLNRILWPMLHVLTVRRPSPQAVKPEPFTSHFDRSKINHSRLFQDHSNHFSLFASQGPKIFQTSKISWAVQLTSY